MLYIYCYTNKINGHTYVGQTNDIERRKREHRSVAYNPKDAGYNSMFHKKLREYGEENFDFEILEEINKCTQEELDEREKFWIKKKHSFIREDGYNLTLGGSGNATTVDRVLTDEEVLALIQEIKNGIPFKELSDKYGIAISYISMINHGLSFKQKNEKYPLYKYYKDDEEYSELIDLLLYSELNMKEIAEKLGIGYSTVKKINYGTLRHGIYPTYPIRTLSPQQRKAKRVQELLQAGYDNLFIIKETGVSVATINRINNGETNYDETLKYPLR